MPVRTARLGVPASMAVGEAKETLFTCPAGHTAIVKGISIAAANVAAITARLDLSVSGVDWTLGRWVLQPGTDGRMLQTWVVLEPGDAVKAVAPAAEAYTVHIFGALLTGVAE